MKIKYVNKVECCCKEMKELMKNDDFFEYQNNTLTFRINLKDGGYMTGKIMYCPFCGEKIEIINQ